MASPSARRTSAAEVGKPGVAVVASAGIARSMAYFDEGHRKGPHVRAFHKRMKGLEPSTFCMASRRSSQLSYIREGGGL